MRNLTEEETKELFQIIENNSQSQNDSTITSNSELVGDLDMDNFSIIETIIEIENKFNIVVPDEDEDDFKTFNVQSVINYIESKLEDNDETQ